MRQTQSIWRNLLEHKPFEQASKLWIEGADLPELHDAEHPDNEDRFIAIGSTSVGTLVVVSAEPTEDLVRTLSARPATGRERERLADYRRGKNV